MDQPMEFEYWRQKYSKTYKSDDEYNKRKMIFNQHVAKMVEHNTKHDKGQVNHRRGLNQFSDMTTEEFLGRNHGKFRI